MRIDLDEVDHCLEETIKRMKQKTHGSRLRSPPSIEAVIHMLYALVSAGEVMRLIEDV